MQTVYQRFRDRRDAPLSQRAVALLLAIGLQLLVILALLKLDDRLSETPETDRPLSTFSLLPAATPARTAVARPKAIAKTKPAASSSAPPSATPPHPTPPADVKQPPPPVNPLFGNRALFAGADIAAMPSHDEDRGAGSSKGDTGTESASTYGPGEGPGGQRLYNVEWVREPSDAELRTYLPPAVAKGSTADIACRTIPDFRVDNCRMLSESPLGSGLARGLREAAWQFRIRPPRVGGKALVGTWVRIHFDFSRDAPKD